MQITLLKSKLHHANVTHSELEYEGSCAIDGALLEAANISEYEQIQIYNLNNGERLVTYTISGERGTGVIELNGPAARLAAVGDKVIIISYGHYDDAEAKTLEPIVVFVDENNRARK